MVESDDEPEEDEFWRIALEAPTQDEARASTLEDDDEPISLDGKAIGRLTTYSFSNGIDFSVSSLEESDGVLSPLGAQAWHASLLMSLYLIDRGALLFEHAIHYKKDGIITCLELGSGAVGLVGMTLATILNKVCPSSSVMLTDLASEQGVLETLKQNVARNKPMFPNVNVTVDNLDWNDFKESATSPSLSPLDLVVGSELVYTIETAEACAAVITRLLTDNPNLVVLILQVIDRPGFETHFVPLLESKGFEVSVEHPLDSDLFSTFDSIQGHERLGGTLDRFAYGLCRIRQKSSIVST